MEWEDFVDRADRERDVQRQIEAIAHPVRRFVIGLLQVGGTYATDLAASASANYGISMSRASEHLRILAKAGLVNVMPDGPWRHYSLNEGAAATLTEWLAETGLDRAPRRD